MRRVAWVAGMAVLPLIAVAGCSSDSKDDQAKGAQAQSAQQLSGELTWWDTANTENEAPVMKELIAEFNKTYPNVQVTYESVPFEEAKDKFKAASQSGSGVPDLMRAEVAWVPELAEAGYLRKLDGTSLVADKADFLPSAYGSTQYEGATYGVPQVTDTLGVMYNKKLLQQAGVDVPTTWDAMKVAAAKIKEKTGKEGAFLNPAGYYLLPFIYGEGGDLIDAKNKKITVNSPASIAGVAKAKELASSSGFAKPPAKDAYNAMMDGFKAGNVGMIVQGPWETAGVVKSDTFGGAENLGIVAAPGGSSRAGGPVGGHDYVISSKMDEAKMPAATAFLTFMASADSQAKIADKLSLLPTRSSAYRKVSSQLVRDWRAPMEQSVPRAWIPAGGELLGPLDIVATKVLTGTSAPAVVMNDVATMYRKILPDYTK